MRKQVARVVGEHNEIVQIANRIAKLRAIEDQKRAALESVQADLAKEETSLRRVLGGVPAYSRALTRPRSEPDSWTLSGRALQIINGSQVGVRCQDIVNSTGKGYSHVFAVLQRMVARGVVTKNGALYRSTATGTP